LEGLGIQDLKSLSWQWLQKTQPEKPWSMFTVQVCFAKALFLTAIVTIVGNGHDTFILLRQVAAWKLNHGTSPNLFATIPKRWQTSAQFRRPQLITDGLRHSRISQVAAL